MAVISVAKNTKATVSMTAGTNPETGKAITKRTTLSKLASNPDATKIMNIVDAAAPVLNYPVSLVETTEVKTLEKTA